MGTTYHYANLTKREWFDAAALGDDSKLHGLGHGLTAHAFNLLLVDEFSRTYNFGDRSPGLLRSWSGDSIAIVGDEDSDTWLRYQREFADLSADVFVLVFRHDGFEPLAEAADRFPRVFFQLCHLIVTRQTPYLDAPMQERFGSHYLQRFKTLRDERGFTHAKDLVRVARD